MLSRDSEVKDFPILESLIDGEHILVKEDLEGQNVVDGSVVLGMKAGPSICVDNACHEMAHLIEIDEARITSVNWG